jgi:tetratricopeptide (TPR) repeat protein
VRFDVRSIAIALASVVVALVGGAVAGDLAGATAGAVVALVSLLAGAVFWVATDQGQRHLARVNRQKEVLRMFAPREVTYNLPVAYYLWPEEAVVPFRVRPELDELMAWCVSGGHAAMRLVTGTAGAGKTRLARQLTEELAANGWQPLPVPREPRIDAIEAVRAMGQPCLLVVDYAETRSGLAGMLNGLAADQDGPDLRVLLLARSAGEWWQQLLASADREAASLLEAYTPVTLGPVQAAGGPQELFDEAVTAFAQRMNVERPDATLMLTEPDPVVLVVHAAALLAVVDSVTGTQSQDQVVSGQQVIDALLRHEARYWVRSAAGRGLDLDVSVLRLAVALGCMVGAGSEADAIALLARIPDLDSVERRGRVARLMHDLYPVPGENDAQESEWLGPLRPDRLAEQLVTDELASRPELIPSLFSDLGEARATRTLTVLARAALTDARAIGVLRSALAADLDSLAVPAVSATVETNPIMGELLNQAISARPMSRETLLRIRLALPYPSPALAASAAVVFRRLADGSTDDGERARFLMNLSNRLGELKRPEEALDAVDDAMRILSELIQSQLYPFLHDYAWALNNRAGHLAQLGRQDESRADLRQSADIFRQLAQNYPGTFLLESAASLNNQSMSLANSERREEALVAIDRATRIFEQLAQVNPNAFSAAYAGALYNKSKLLADLERIDEALSAIELATKIYRPLARNRPGQFRQPFVETLQAYANVLSMFGRNEEASEIRNEADAEDGGN